MLLLKFEVCFVHYLVENKILAGPQTCPLQCEAIHEHPCVLPNLWTNKTKLELYASHSNLLPPL
jgi:hypothetical protein